jgi:hypothetical protein
MRGKGRYAREDERNETMKTPAAEFIIEKATWIENTPPKSIGNLPYPTHSGELELFVVVVKCHRLSDGQTIIEESSMMLLLKHLGFLDIDDV